MPDSSSSGNFQRQLKNRHVQLIALGGSVGTGLFLGTAHTIQLAGPSILLGYAMAGLIAFFIMRQLAEMVVEEPVAGSFSHFAYKYWGPFAGFAAGWNYWVLYILVSMAELTAVGLYMHYWLPDLPGWVSVLGCFVIVNAINLRNVSLFGELEFYCSLIKVLAVVGMIVFGLYLLLSGSGGPQAQLSNLWARGGFFPHGVSGLLLGLAIIMFSFGGLELVGIAAAETSDPAATIPKATNQVVIRILIFFIGSQAVLLTLFPWDQVSQGGSPFVMIFAALHSPWVATLLNAVVLIAALSVYNSATYSTSRMLTGLARQGNAPACLGRLNKRGVPTAALLVSAAASGLCVVINYALPARALDILMMLVVAALVFNWLIICLTHLKFVQHQRKAGRTSHFPSPLKPWSNHLCLGFLCAILVIMLASNDMRLAVLILPVWVAIIGVCYWGKQRQARSAQGNRPA